MAHLGFIGLGAMGSRLSRRLLDAGDEVHGWNRTADKARDLVAAGLTLAKAPRGPDGVVAGLGPRATLVEMSTVSPVVVRELVAPVVTRGATIIDAPVSGSTITVEHGTASFL